MVDGNRIRLTLPGGWDEKGARFALDRVARMVCDRSLEAVETSEHEYALDAANNWWGSWNPQDREVVITYRYGDGSNQPKMVAMNEVIQWLTGLRERRPTMQK